MSSIQRIDEASQTNITTGPYSGFDIRAIRAEVVITTPELAATLRKTCHFVNQRDIKPLNVQRLLGEAQRGTFVAGTPIFICVLPDMSMHIINGNHTLEMVAALGHSVPLTFIYARVASIHQAGEIYATFDLHKMRTWMDALRATGVGDDVDMVSFVLPALGIILQGFSSFPNTDAMSRDLRFGMIKDYKDAASILAHAIKGAPIENQRKIRNALTFSVALATTKYQPTSGAEFWGGMAHDNGLKTNDPRKALLRFSSSGKGGASRTDRIRAAILAWNAFFKNQPLEYCRPNTVKNIRILGTPFDGEIVQPKHRKAAVASDPLPRATKESGRMFTTGQITNGSGTAPITLFQG